MDELKHITWNLHCSLHKLWEENTLIHTLMHCYWMQSKKIYIPNSSLQGATNGKWWCAPVFCYIFCYEKRKNLENGMPVWWQFPPNCHPRSFNESDTKVTLLGWQFQWKWHQSDTLGVAVWCHFSIFIVNTNKTRGGSFIESDTLGVAV